ncbi:hypothetical protein [Bernardetia sp.]|uniref:hypothetical protein n=1 Tax=Bernardetia sp. TaxID=1937974 RepID=UPI0025C4856B|nr:hypothetical protein [Bernardetia sp.]
MWNEEEIKSLEPIDFIKHIIHELRQNSSFIDACSKIIKHSDKDNLNDEQKMMVSQLDKKVKEIKQLENLITTYLNENKASK